MVRIGEKDFEGGYHFDILERLGDNIKMSIAAIAIGMCNMKWLRIMSNGEI